MNEVQQALPECATLIPRPEDNDPRVIDAALRKILPQINQWLGRDAGDDVETLRQLAEALRREPDDEYRMARVLDFKYYWECNAELVDILESIDLYGTRDKFVEDWLIETGIQPQLKVGDAISFEEPRRCSRAPQRYEGTVATVDLKRGSYTINIPALGHLAEGERDGRKCGTIGNCYRWEEIDNQLTR
jgi:hypothetical protein